MTITITPDETVETVQVYRYKAMGFTDDITSCDLCGREELKGTVRLVVRDADGDEAGEVYAGVVCAAKADGRKAAEVRAEAKRAEDEARATYQRWANARSAARAEFWEEARARLGMPRNSFDIDLDRDERWPAWQAAQVKVNADETYQARMVEWDEANREPVEGRPRIYAVRAA